MMASDKVLLVIPSSNTTVTPEMAALLPGYGTQFVARIPPQPGTLTPDGIPAYAEAVMEATAPFVNDRPDLVVFGCTSAGFLAGAAGNQAIVDRLAEQFGSPVISMADGMVQALLHDGAKRVAVLTPYLPPVNDGLRRYLEAAGIEVAVLDSFLCPTIEALCAVTEEDVLVRAIGLDTAGCDAVFIACSQLPTLGVLPMLREKLGLPIWSSISATAWMAARMRAAPAVAA